MQIAMNVLLWLCGTTSGALWIAALEREDHKMAELYVRFMSYCYGLSLVLIALS